ncbi:Shedu anti-phage system protein SduA domain-containing protein [Neobacillus drentensis]|uniref:Shedu anti-phage system protein SduA domain-containing protein n=1 Tax=Neobacillus drentensis TaxID=220684 RepID=UPI003000C5FA
MNISAEIIELFSKNFLEQINKSDNLFENYISVEKTDYLPKAFTGKSAAITSYYSEDREHILIVFFKSDQYRFSFEKVKGNVIDVYDRMKLWRGGAGLRIENGGNIRIKSTMFSGMRPADLYGDIEGIFEEFTMKLPYPKDLEVTLDYALVFSKKYFLSRLEQQKTFANNIAMNYVDYYIKTGEKFESSRKKANVYKKELNMLKVEMKKYFFSNKFKETEIDDFIGKNPTIIKYGLGLSRFFTQMILKDIHNNYKQDLKPDLLGFDPIEEHWRIVDYKLPWKKLIRGEGTVRASVTSDITQLHSQLKTYRDYFADHAQREYVNNKYKININKYPPAIGVIGTVTQEQREDFNEMRQEYPGWFKVMSYDELYKKVCDFIDVINEID